MNTKNFITTMTSPLGDGQLLFSHLTGCDAMGTLFEFDLDLLRPEALGSVDSQALMGHDITIKIGLADGITRYINGAVVQIKHTGMVNRFYCYRAVLRPWLWFLTLTSNCRIFQDKSTLDIIKAVFADYAFANVEYHLEETYESRAYCVQYRESDFDFVSRLMEHEGIFYYFKHQQGKHILIIIDSGSSYQQIEGYQTIPYFPPENKANRERDHIYEWLGSNQVCTGKYEINDFDYESPSANLTTKAQKFGKYGRNDMAFYDFPGQYNKTAVGTKIADKRMEELHSRKKLIQGAGNAISLQPGMEFTLSGFYFTEENVKHFVISTSYEIGGGGGYASGNDSGESVFSCHFIAMDAQQSFRPSRNTPKPVISGTQTALVVGKDGEEIWTDKYGRIKVKFHWDRDENKNETSSCWIRLSYPVAGKKWGWVSLPRIGQEVIVSFLNGDPDQPLVTGGVYNAEQMPPYDLPANQTQSGIKTRSSKTGVQENFNEIRFDDKKDSEELYIHAEKDFNCVIENNETRKIGLDKKDKGNQTLEIQNDRTISLNEGHDMLTIKMGNRETNVDTGNSTLNVKNGNKESNINTGNDTTNVKMGNYVVKVNGGKATIEAMQSIELKVGGNSIKIDQSGITIKGITVKVQADVTLDAKSPMTTVGGDGILTLKGGITMIN